jgi:hypothetical protein
MDYFKIFESLLYSDTAEKVKDVLQKNNLWDDKSLWRYYGDIDNNLGTIHAQQSQPVKAFVEKIANSIDAILILNCVKSGINPEDWELTPRTVGEAAKLFVKNNPKISINKNELERLIYVYAEGNSGKGTEPTMCIYDDGEGQEPHRVTGTILSLQKSNKNKIQFLQGQYNMGGSGVLRFCKEGLQFVLTKRNKYLIKDNSKNPWSFTVVREEQPEGRMERNAFYTYLAPLGAEKNPRKGEIMTFEKETLPLIPKQNKSYQIQKESGTLIKCFGFNNKKKSNILLAGEFLSSIETMMPDCPLPVRFVECRPFKGHAGSYESTMVGLINKLNRDDVYKETLEEGFPIRNNINIAGNNIPILTYAFQRSKKDKSKSNASSRRLDKEGIIFTMNGQHYYDLPFSFYSRAKLQRIAVDLISVVDCSQLDNKMRAKIFMASKDNIAKTPEYYELENQLKDIFKKSEELKLLQNRRASEEAKQKTENNKVFEDLLSKLVQNPALAALFGTGTRISSAFNLQTADDQIEEKKKDLKEFPSFFKFKKLEYGETLIRTAQEDKQIRINFETDAVDDYFIREDKNGQISIVLDKDKYKDIKLIYSYKIKNGIFSVNITQPETALQGEVLNFIFTINDESQEQPFINKAEIKIIEENKQIDDDPHEPPEKPLPPKPKDNEKKEVPGGLDLPEPKWVTIQECPNYSFEAFDEFDGLVVQFRSEENKVDKYDYYINADNRYYLHYLKTTKVEQEVIKERYKTALTLIAVSMLAEHKLKNENDSEDDIEIKIRFATRSISRVLLPIIEVLGSLDDTSLSVAD